MPPLRLLLIVLVILNLLALAAGQGWLGSSEPRGEPERLSNQIHPEGISLKPALASDAIAQPQSRPSPPPDPTTPETPVMAPSAPPVVVAQPEAAEPVQPAPAVTADSAASPSAPSVSPEPAPERNVEEEGVPGCIAFQLAQPLADALDRLIHTASTKVKTTRVVVEPPSTWWVRIPPLASRAAAERRVLDLRAQGVSDLFIVREPGPNQNAISLGLFRTEASARQHQTDLLGKRVRDTEIVPRNPAIHRLEIRAASNVLETLSRRLPSEMPQAIRDECQTP
ncbi:MAG: SPOR domain-containing protein [Rhodocyclaceae bacterium]|jgi:hypothetical protein|nr:SPOR domain-containing protein [Rhodocyclaceae bacterium]MCL4759351.1 SPOR domain-containing protein [Rhodocyclaceae bacterium]